MACQGWGSRGVEMTKVVSKWCPSGQIAAMGRMALQDTLATEPCWLLVPLHPRKTVICQVGVCVFWVYSSLFQALSLSLLHPHPWPAQFPPPPPGSAAPLSGTGQVWSQGKAVLAGPGKSRDDLLKRPIKCPVLYILSSRLPPNPSSPGFPPPPVLLPL